jgi:hypothetical protein
MRVLTALVLFVAIAGCGDRKERVSGSVDTTVTTRSAQDTTIVTSDTTIRSDTTRMEGDIKRDSTKH